jgi:hypothetical protein
MEWMEKDGIQEVGITTDGITADYVWWNADLLVREMTGWTGKFDKLVKVMEARHKEHLAMIGGLLEERKRLKEQRISEQEAVVIYNELQEAESFLYNLVKINTDTDDYQFVQMTPLEVEGQISIVMDRLSQLCKRLEKKE